MRASCQQRIVFRPSTDPARPRTHVDLCRTGSFITVYLSSATPSPVLSVVSISSAADDRPGPSGARNGPLSSHSRCETIQIERPDKTARVEAQCVIGTFVEDTAELIEGPTSQIVLLLIGDRFVV